MYPPSDSAINIHKLFQTKSIWVKENAAFNQWYVGGNYPNTFRCRNRFSNVCRSHLPYYPHIMVSPLSQCVFIYYLYICVYVNTCIYTVHIYIHVLYIYIPRYLSCDMCDTTRSIINSGPSHQLRIRDDGIHQTVVHRLDEVTCNGDQRGLQCWILMGMSLLLKHQE